MACRRCGVCCTYHQAFVTPADLERITAYLGITIEDWDRLYDDTRWKFSEYRLIKHTGGACVFLRYDKGMASCVIHAVKPACCAAWQPDPDRPECQEGMRMRRGQK
jgi:Fe-S-cluster containining protein